MLMGIKVFNKIGELLVEEEKDFLSILDMKSYVNHKYKNRFFLWGGEKISNYVLVKILEHKFKDIYFKCNLEVITLNKWKIKTIKNRGLLVSDLRQSFQNIAETESNKFKIKDIKKITLNNFHNSTYSDFRNLYGIEIEYISENKPDFISPTGSAYWHFVKEGYSTRIIRRANHWGRINSCYWTLNGRKGSQPYNQFGVADLSDFRLFSKNFYECLTHLLNEMEKVENPQNYDDWWQVALYLRKDSQGNIRGIKELKAKLFSVKKEDGTIAIAHCVYDSSDGEQYFFNLKNI